MGGRAARIPKRCRRIHIESLPLRRPSKTRFLRNAQIGTAEAGVDSSRANLDQVRADLAAQLRVRVTAIAAPGNSRMKPAFMTSCRIVRRRIAIGVSVAEAARFGDQGPGEVMNAASRKEAAHLNVQRAKIGLMQLTAQAYLPISGYKVAVRSRRRAGAGRLRRNTGCRSGGAAPGGRTDPRPLKDRSGTRRRVSFSSNFAQQFPGTPVHL